MLLLFLWLICVCLLADAQLKIHSHWIVMAKNVYFICEPYEYYAIDGSTMIKVFCFFFFFRYSLGDMNLANHSFFVISKIIRRYLFGHFVCLLSLFLTLFLLFLRPTVSSANKTNEHFAGICAICRYFSVHFEHNILCVVCVVCRLAQKLVMPRQSNDISWNTKRFDQKLIASEMVWPNYGTPSN